MPKTLSKRSSAASSSKLQLGSFTVLPLVLAQPSSSASTSKAAGPPARHYLYVRPDLASSTAAADDSRTLFVANLPVDADEDKVRAVFGEVGAIEDIRFGGAAGGGPATDAVVDDGMESEDDEAEDEEEEEEADASGALELPDGRPRPPKRAAKLRKAKAVAAVTPLFADSLPTLLPSGASTAKVTFLSSLSLARALALPARPWPTSSSPAGLAHFLRKHEALRPPLALVKAHADSSILAFEKLQAERKRTVTDRQAMVDDDGFTLVVRGGKYGKDAGGGGVGVASKRWETEWAEAEKAGGANPKKKSKELKDFYRWQVREAKREDLASMRAKFADDQQKVERLRAGRRFMPY